MIKYSVLNVKIRFKVPCFKASILSLDLRQSLTVYCRFGIEEGRSEAL